MFIVGLFSVFHIDQKLGDFASTGKQKDDRASLNENPMPMKSHHLTEREDLDFTERLWNVLRGINNFSNWSDVTSKALMNYNFAVCSEWRIHSLCLTSNEQRFFVHHFIIPLWKVYCHFTFCRYSSVLLLRLKLVVTLHSVESSHFSKVMCMVLVQLHLLISVISKGVSNFNVSGSTCFHMSR